MQKTVTRTIAGVRYDNIVIPGKTLDPNTEEMLFGDELKNEYHVLCTNLVNPDETPELLRYRNRWATVKRIRVEDTGVYFVLKYDDGDMIIRQCDPTSGWWVTKKSIQTVEAFEALFEKQQRENGPFSGLKFGSKSKPGFKTDDEIENDGTPANGVAYEAPEPAETVVREELPDTVFPYVDPNPTGIFDREELVERHGEPTKVVGGYFEAHDEPTKTVDGIYEV